MTGRFGGIAEWVAVLVVLAVLGLLEPVANWLAGLLPFAGQ